MVTSVISSNSVESFTKFLEDYFDGKIKPYVKSEAVPDSNDGPVKVSSYTHLFYNFT